MKRVEDQRGISLLEVLASISLFAVVAAGLSVTTVGNIKANGSSKNISAAAALVQDRIERFRALASGSPDLTAGTHTDPLNPMTPLGQAGGKFNRTWTVTPNTPKIGLSLVVVTVTWSDPASRSLTGVTYVCSTQTCG